MLRSQCQITPIVIEVISLKIIISHGKVLSHLGILVEISYHSKDMANVKILIKKDKYQVQGHKVKSVKKYSCEISKTL
jgi:hypothetical protein